MTMQAVVSAVSSTRGASNGPLEVLLAGPWHVGEFAFVRDEIDAESNWVSTRTLKDAVALIAAEATPPELVLLAQPRPGCDEQADVERLRRIAPLARVIVVAGSWCEGELRTGRPLVGVMRLYWYELPAWWRAGLAQLARGQSPPWAEPLDDVRAGQPIRAALAASGGRLVIDATDFAVFETLAAGVAPLGWHATWHPRHRPKLAEQIGGEKSRAIAGLWDGGQLGPAELQSLRQFCHQMKCRLAPVIALLDFPRAEHIEMAQTAGAVAIMAKPYQIAHLVDEMARLISKKRTADRADFTYQEP